jgi:hypothetical protein
MEESLMVTESGLCEVVPNWGVVSLRVDGVFRGRCMGDRVGEEKTNQRW